MIISFLNKKAKPDKPQFFKLISKLLALIKGLPYQIKFAHIPRDKNQLADWFTLLPRVLCRDVDAMEIDPPLIQEDSPPWAP